MLPCGAMCLFVELQQLVGQSIGADCLAAAELAVAPWVSGLTLCSLHEGRLSVHSCDLLDGGDTRNFTDPEPYDWRLDELGATVLADALAAALPLMSLPVAMTAMWDGQVTASETTVTAAELIAAIRDGHLGNRVRYLVS